MLDVKSDYDDGTKIPEEVLILMQQDRVWWTLFAMIMVTCIAFCLSLFIKEDLKRLRYKKATI